MFGFSSFLSQLKQPEYVHVLLNHWPLEGMAAGVFILLMALVFGRERERWGALLWLTVMSVAMWMTVRSGQGGYDRVSAMSTSEAQAWLDLHANRAKDGAFVFYLSGAAALASLLARRRETLSRRLAILAFALGVVSIGLAGWISHAGGQIRHSEFRAGPPPTAARPHE
jgi:hypothetical protein